MRWSVATKPELAVETSDFAPSFFCKKEFSVRFKEVYTFKICEQFA